VSIDEKAHISITLQMIRLRGPELVPIALLIALQSSSFGFVLLPTSSGSCRSYTDQSESKRGEALFTSTTFQEPKDSDFGRQDFWNDFYRDKKSFAWYSGWTDLAPFVTELISTTDRVLIPGIGNDPAIVDMYDDGYTNMVAFDYAKEGVDRARALFGDERNNAELHVADARSLKDLIPVDGSIDAVFDKGTLDAVYLSGGADKELGLHHLELAIQEAGRVLRKGGIMLSVSAACVDHVQSAFDRHSDSWECIRDGSFYTTEDGYTSNNVDGTILAWRKR